MTDSQVHMASIKRRVGSNKTGELLGIQYLRGVAAMLVVAYHLDPQLRHMAYTGPWVPGLTGGVDIFFVISGFIMWMTTSTKRIGTFKFWERRAIRIVPLYWLITAAMVLLLWIAPQFFQTSRFDIAHIVSSFFFLPLATPRSSGHGTCRHARMDAQL